MKNFKVLVVIVTLLIATNCVLIGLLWYNNYSKAKPPADIRGGQAAAYLTRELKLTPQQLAKYQGMVTTHREFTQQVNMGLRARRDSFFDQLKNPSLNKNEIDALEQRILNDQRRLDSATFYHFRGFRAILLPAQQSKFDEVINHVLHMMARPQGGRPGGPQAQGQRFEGPPPMDGQRQGPPPNGAARPQGPGAKPGQAPQQWVPPHLDSTMRPLLDTNGKQVIGPEGRPIFVPKDPSKRRPDGRPYGPPPGGRPPMGPPPGEGPPPAGQPL